MIAVDPDPTCISPLCGPERELCARCRTAGRSAAADRRISAGSSGREATRPRRAERAKKILVI